VEDFIEAYANEHGRMQRIMQDLRSRISVLESEEQDRRATNQHNLTALRERLAAENQRSIAELTASLDADHQRNIANLTDTLNAKREAEKNKYMAIMQLEMENIKKENEILGCFVENSKENLNVLKSKFLDISLNEGSVQDGKRQRNE
jgi:hypothetical protein